MSDLEFSGSDSEPVSEVNPEEMARLMADIDDIDADLFKKNSAPSSKSNTGDANPSNHEKKAAKRQVTFSKKLSPGKTNDDDDEDWDADDLLYSDDDLKPPRKPPNRSPSQGKSPSPGKGEADAGKSKDINVDSSQRTKNKKKLMAELFSDDPPSKSKSAEISKSPVSSASKKDKSKLMEELFGGGDDPGNQSSSISPGNVKQKSVEGKTGVQGAKKKATDDSMFQDDGDDLLGDFGEAQKKVTTSPKGGSFLDSLLSKSSAINTPKRGMTSDFVLDDKYKRHGKEETASGGFKGYTPSASKPDSPRRRTPRKSPAKDNLGFDFLGDAEPRKRISTSAPHKKPFEIDDDDILGNVKSYKKASKEPSKNNAASDPNINSRVSSAPGTSKNRKKDDWLFGDSEEASKTMKKNMDESAVAASVEKPTDTLQESLSKDEDWLGGLLSSSKKSPDVSKQAQVTEGQASMRHPNPAPPSHTSPHSPHNAPSEAAPSPGVRGASLQPPVLPAAPIPQAAAPTDWSQNVPQQHLRQQQEAQAAAAALAVQMKTQQDQIDAQMAQQLHHQQQQMAELMKKQQEAAEKRYQDAVAAMSQYNQALPLSGNSISEQHKNMEVNLKEAETEAAKAKAELELIRKQHAQEITMLEEGHMRQLEVEQEVWKRVEARLREERDSLLSDFQNKLTLLQEEKKNLSTSYEVQLRQVKEEWSQAVEHTRELYTGMLERMREEHTAALQRMTHLKELELKAALSATGQVKEVEVVMAQLETNTSDLTELTAAINFRHDSTLELTQKALKMKEKQLKDFEDQLGASRAEAESERGRLNALIHRLENTLLQQGSEIEKERWRLAQERMKIETERQAMIEERKHLQLSTETERQNLAKARDNLLSEHRTLLQSVAQQRQEVTNMQASLSAQQRLPYIPATGTGFSANKITMMSLDADMTVLSEERRLLQGKMAAVNRQEQHLKEEQTRLDQLSLQLEQDRLKLNLEKEAAAQELASLGRARKDLDTTKEEIKALQLDQQQRLNQIATQTRSLHHQEEKVEREHIRLQQTREEVVRLGQLGLCPVCQGRGGAELVLGQALKGHTKRLPGDGGEGHSSSVPLLEPLAKPPPTDRSPASVLARLTAAREQENEEREKRLLRISALESS